MSTAWSSVRSEFTSLHSDRFNPTDVHEHTWAVEVWWPSEHVRDARHPLYVRGDQPLEPFDFHKFAVAA